MEVFPLTGDGADLGLFTVTEHYDGVKVEQMGDGIQIVGIVAFVGRL